VIVRFGGLGDAVGERKTVAGADRIGDAHVENLRGGRDAGGLPVLAGDQAGHRRAMTIEGQVVADQIHVRDLIRAEGWTIFNAAVHHGHCHPLAPGGAVARGANRTQKTFAFKRCRAAAGGPVLLLQNVRGARDEIGLHADFRAGLAVAGAIFRSRLGWGEVRHGSWPAFRREPLVPARLSVQCNDFSLREMRRQARSLPWVTLLGTPF
jgi:hypothetical protein